MIRRTLLAACLALPLAAPVGAEDAPRTIPNAQSPQRLVTQLRDGGLVLYVRHAPTERDTADQVSAVMGDCSTQRMLSEAGWAQARQLGAHMRRLQIPVGTVISSEYCRAWQTADLAFGRYRKNAALNFEKAAEYTEEQTAAMRSRLQPLLSQRPAPGKNTVIVGHDDPFEAATGIYPDPMGVAWVLRPDGNGRFALLGQITPDQWAAVR
ncbi:MAG: histidine phosphatase family protein [Alphaproteobacteria bacterium]|nr:histidine phosphatase family protein [Alphaproteobacteria bacterium]